MPNEIEMIEARAASLVESHVQLLEDLINQRKRHSISQEVVAERMGVTQPTVAAFERYDANPTLATIRRYALAVDALIEHRVTDECAAHTPGYFDAVVRSAGLVGWTPRYVADGEWHPTDWVSGDRRVEANQ